jgi:NAD(P)-dependent dehydrogenase (short-subunit alcohol dehydrogenase family)
VIEIKETKMGRLQGKVAIVTGAGSGIGRAISLEYAREGAVVGVLDRNGPTALETVSQIEQNGGKALPFTVDVTDYDRMRGIRDELDAAHGGIHILVNNAAYQIHADFFAGTLEEWRGMIAVDLEAVYMGSKLMAEVMRRQNEGRIINIASIQAYMTTGRLPAYNSAKSGVVGLTRAMAVDLAPYNILVNAIAPGFVRTNMSIGPDGVDETDTEHFKEYYMKSGRVPLGRPGLPHDIAGTALFFASDDCRYLTGQTLLVDGGLSLTI